MPDLSFTITGVDASVPSITPMLRFRVKITNAPVDEIVQAVLLSAQIQLQPAQRSYNPREQEKLIELFGRPENWGQTLRNRLWTQANTIAGAFAASTETTFQIPCTYDLNVAATKYFFALEGGEVSLLFLFSGSVFYVKEDGRLQVAPISWNKECAYRMSAQTWTGLMDRYYPNTAWLTLDRDIFNRLCALKRERGLPSLDQTVEELLRAVEPARGARAAQPQRCEAQVGGQEPSSLNETAVKNAEVLA